ncbi:MAG: MFS transporter [Chloroflexi bacterium]|nr:MFS transporter [Chloroflexota bacterium]
MLAGAVAGSPHYKWWVFAAVGLGTFTGVMTFGSVNVALPTIADHFGSDLPTIQWVVIAQTLTISALLLPMGRLSDLVGRKRVYITGLLFLVGASVFAALSPNVTLLILSRVVQGVGAAMTQGTAMAMITTVFPDEERGKGIGSHMSMVGAGGMAGPAIGGLLVSAFGWRSVFLINLPLASIALLGALLLLDSKLFHREQRGIGFDWPGATLSTAALVTFLLLMTNGNRLGWDSPIAIAAALLFVALVAGFLAWESKAPAPMLDLGLFRNRVFSLGVLASFMSFLSTGSVRFLMPFYLQGVLGFPAGQVGLIMLPTAVTMTITGPIAGRLSDRFGYRIFNVLGLVIAAVGIFVISRVSESTPVALIIAALVVQSAGSGLFSSPNSASIFSASSSARHGIVSALLSLVRNSANVTSIALGTAVVAATMAGMGFAPDLRGVASADGSGAGAAFVSGMNLLYTGTGCLLLLGAVASFFKGGDLPSIGSARGRPRRGRARTS